MHYPLLALLVAAPADGPKIKEAFDATFGLSWPEVSFGQLYATLAALEHEGFVEAQGQRRDQKMYALTPSGAAALASWVATPVEGPEVNDDLFLKLVVGRCTQVGSSHDLIERQRQWYLQSLHDIQRSLALGPSAASDDGDPMAHLLLEHAALRTEADLKWLDVCERILTGESPTS